MKIPCIRLLLVILFPAVPAAAATDGALGATSTGTAGITVSVPGLVRIAGLADLSLGTWSGSGDVNGNDDVCVYTNIASGTYRITVTGNGAGNSFRAASGGNTLPYHVYWNDQTGTTGQVEVTAGTTLTNQNTTSSACASATGNFQVKILSTDLAVVPSGGYTGTVSFLVEPS